MSDSADILNGHRRMRECLAGIRHLDPAGVDARLVDFDREIARLEQLLGVVPAVVPAATTMEFVVIGPPAACSQGPFLKAA